MQDWLKKLWADGAYGGELIAWIQEQIHVELEMISSEAGQKGFVLLPRRWILERAFACLANYRRLSIACEAEVASSEAMIYCACFHRYILERIAK